MDLNKIDKARNGALQSPTSKTSEPSHAELSGPARARLEASRGVASGIPRPSQAWRFKVSGDVDRSDEAIKCELDAMLLAGPQQASHAHNRRGVSEADVPAPDAATTLRKVSRRWELFVSMQHVVRLCLRGVGGCRSKAAPMRVWAVLPLALSIASCPSV